jgi:REP element-mobilizing transposase RayT
MSTLATHIISTTHGTWLPGDDRGHWSPLFNLYGQLTRDGHQLNMPDQTSIDISRTRLTEPPKLLSLPERTIIATEFANHFRYPHLPPPNHHYTVTSAATGQIETYMKPNCHAAAIESNHFHLLLSPLEEDLDRYIGRLKGKSSSTLKKLPDNHSRQHLWTAKFWRVFLYDPEATLAVRHYITTHNRRQNLPEDPYPFISPLTW